jgi:hypothetical protein
MMAVGAKVATAKEADASGAEPAVVVRSDFRSTVFWKPDVMTGEDGTATVKFTYPDSLTSWRTTARAATIASQFGIAKETTRTKKPLLVRLQAPRFFVVGDQTVVSAVVNNNTDRKLTVVQSLDAAGVVVTGLYVDGKMLKGEAGPISVDPRAHRLGCDCEAAGSRAPAGHGEGGRSQRCDGAELPGRGPRHRQADRGLRKTTRR